jgi:hypothetical protein
MRLLATLTIFALATPALAMDTIELTEDEFRMYRQYKAAMEDPRVQAMKPEKQLPAIAKDAKYKLKDLKKAIERAEAAGDLKKICEANLKEVMADSELKGRTGRLEVDTDAAQAVAYVQWFNEDLKKLPIEASFAAAKAAKACPIASTITVWAQMKGNVKTRVFQAMISGSAAGRIKEDQVRDFAETRYMRLFEKVKNLANGDDFSTEGETPSAEK